MATKIQAKLHRCKSTKTTRPTRTSLKHSCENPRGLRDTHAEGGAFGGGASRVEAGSRVRRRRYAQDGGLHVRRVLLLRGRGGPGPDRRGSPLCEQRQACDHCLRALEKAEENAQRLTGKPGQVLPHPELCTVRQDLHQSCPHCRVTYCSAECRLAAAEQYHQILCPGPSQDDPAHPLNKLQEAWRSVHYPPETASIMLMARMVATVKQAKDKDRWIRLFSQFCNKTANEEEEIVHKLLGDKFKGQLELLRRLFTEALYEEALSQWFTPDGFRSLFALVGTNGQGIGTSSLSQWVHACDALELKPEDREQLDAFIDQLYKDIEAATGEFLNCEGSGLFVLQSCCNHSCVPNAETSFPENNFLLHVTALEDIKPGEEICISYLDCCQRERSRHSRHKILRENYLFVCSCPKCLAEADEPNMTSEEEEEEEEEEEGEPEDAELGDEMTDV
uniref:Protein-lysine N-trimethyltransferase SMYD5 n=1 Tax=Bos indicus x Bos taurus TaxID=30522 RepID=A0A4W2HES2_BOBOX